MELRTFRRATALALAGLLVSATAAFADSVPADVDQVATGNQSTIDLGHASTGQTVVRTVSFKLVCLGTTHAEPGQILTLTGVGQAPLDGSITATSATIGPVPTTWPPTDIGCPFPAPSLSPNELSVVTLVMPTTPGDDYFFQLMYTRSGATGLTGTTAVSFRIDVLPNTPPTLVVPDPIVAEATSSAGAAVVYAVSATDEEDEPDPSPVCVPASGAVFPITTTTVDCSVTDAGGRTVSASFDVTVADTTAPVLAGVPASLEMTTTDPTGVALVYTMPTATDAVDPAPSVVCAPAPGTFVAVGGSFVACSATDATGDESTASFPVTVTYDPGYTWTAVWGAPVGGTLASLVANLGRTIPVKVQIFSNGVEQTTGDASLRVTACGGTSGVVMPLTWGSARWEGHLDTSSLSGGCYVVTATLDGHDAGSFALDLRGAEAAKTPASGKGPTK